MSACLEAKAAKTNLNEARDGVEAPHFFREVNQFRDDAQRRSPPPPQHSRVEMQLSGCSGAEEAPGHSGRQVDG